MNNTSLFSLSLQNSNILLFIKYLHLSTFNPLTILPTDLSVNNIVLCTVIYTFITTNGFKYFINSKIIRLCKIPKNVKWLIHGSHHQIYYDFLYIINILDPMWFHILFFNDKI